MENLPKHTDTRKPCLSVEQQIAHLRSKGVTFKLCDEARAAKILSEQDHYFKLAAYRVLFPKRVGGAHDGEYAGLDFAHLVDLAEIDHELRDLLLPMSLDVEGAAKTKLINRITANPDEDGYGIFSNYLESLSHDDRNRRQGEIKRLENDAYLGSLAAKYPIDEMPVWVFLELASFGAFTNFYLFCSDRWADATMRSEHYLLRCVNSLRNATAHSSAIINGFGSNAEVSLRIPRAVAESLGSIGINKRLRRSKMRNLRIFQITTLAYAFISFVPEKNRAVFIKKLDALENRAKRHADWYEGNTTICSAYGYLANVFESWIKWSMMPSDKNLRVCGAESWKRFCPIF